MMTHDIKKFKIPPKRFHPQGLIILYEDHDIVVVNKGCGLLTISTDKEKENTAYYLLNDYVRKGNPKSKKRVFIVHRLDKETSGVIVFAKSEKAKRFLQDEWKLFKKIYYVIVSGHMPKQVDIITSYLAENAVYKMYSVKDAKEGKLSKTAYKVVRVSEKYSLLEIKLLTGRKNQIRVHLSEEGCPIVGDKKYGFKDKGVKRLALHSASLTIKHPHTKEDMEFSVKAPQYFKTLMGSL